MTSQAVLELYIYTSDINNEYCTELQIKC